MTRTPEVFAEDLGFIEGPAWSGDSLYVVSISRSVVYELDGATGALRGEVSVGGGPNGLTVGRDGIYVAQNGGIFGAPEKGRPGVQRVAGNDVSYVGGGPFIAPNDVCFGPDACLYVSDPVTERGLRERVPGTVQRVDLEKGTSTAALSDLPFPNGLAVDTTGQFLYLALSFAHTIERYRFTGAGLAHDGTACDLIDGRPDGFALDLERNLWIAVPGKGHIAVFSPVGQELDRIDCGEGSVTTNCCFGGPGMSTLYATAAGQGKLLAIETETQGIPLLPFR